METELKTLKDIQEVWGEKAIVNDIDKPQEVSMTVKGLFDIVIREQAIKWIIELNQASLKSEFMESPVGYENFGAAYDGEVGNVVNWIKHFFNLTEEELNDVKRGLGQQDG